LISFLSLSELAKKKGEEEGERKALGEAAELLE
jgi:hypothetical protein